MRLVAVVVSCLLLPCAAVAATLSISPAAGMRDEPLSVFRIEGLEPNQLVTLRGRTDDLPGAPWTSEARFRASAAGVVDVAADHPISGSYRSKDIMGPLWSITSADPFALTFMLIGAFPMGTFTMQFDVLDEGGNVLAQADVVRRSARPDAPVTREDWTPPGKAYSMSLYYPANAAAKQTVVHVTGSGGGRLEGFCEMLAAHGYFAACVPYFGEPGTPPTLSEVPLEHFAGAIDAVLEHPKAVGDEVVFSGVSRGGEASLVVSSTFPSRVKATLSFMPAAHVWDGETTDFTAPPRSAWTLGGAPLPFLRIDYQHLLRFNPTFPWTATPTFRWSEAHATQEERVAARIPVERIDGPVFLASGLDDQLCPCDEYAHSVAATLRAAGRPFVNVKGTDAGHLAFNVAYTPVPQTVALIYECGGTPEGTSEASAKIWREVLAFLGRL